MKHLKAYKIFESNISSGLNKDQISFLDTVTDKWTYNESTGLVDVEGKFNCSWQRLKDFIGINFGTINGDFYCQHNLLTSMEGMPKYIKGNFDCSNNKIESLVGSPILLKTVEHTLWDVGNFECEYNNLTSFEGIPDLVYYKLNVSCNRITGFDGAPKKLHQLNIGFNPIKSLEESPEVIDSYHCSSLEITSLKGAPQKLRGSFFCSYNKYLESLEGGPKEVYYYMARNCDLDNLRGGPIKAVELNVEGNKLKTLEDVAESDFKNPIVANDNPASEDFLRITASKEWINMDDEEKDSFIILKNMGLL